MAEKKADDWTNPLARTESLASGWAKPEETAPVKPTWPEDNSDLDSGKVRASGVGLKDGEIAALDKMAKWFDTSRNGLIRLAVRQFLLDYRAGRLDMNKPGLIEDKPPKREPKRRINYPR